VPYERNRHPRHRPLVHDGVLARTGLVDTSLRSLAAEMGTSARMLVYYFGSDEFLLAPFAPTRPVAIKENY
jgi:hypothetical protein